MVYGEIDDKKIEMEIKMERDFYQSSLKEAVEAVVMHYKLDKERVQKIAEQVYEGIDREDLSDLDT